MCTIRSNAKGKHSFHQVSQSKLHSRGKMVAMPNSSKTPFNQFFDKTFISEVSEVSELS
jgi:hypothetical protein